MTQTIFYTYLPSHPFREYYANEGLERYKWDVYDWLLQAKGNGKDKDSANG